MNTTQLTLKTGNVWIVYDCHDHDYYGLSKSVDRVFASEAAAEAYIRSQPPGSSRYYYDVEEFRVE